MKYVSRNNFTAYLKPTDEEDVRQAAETVLHWLRGRRRLQAVTGGDMRAQGFIKAVFMWDGEVFVMTSGSSASQVALEYDDRKAARHYLM